MTEGQIDMDGRELSQEEAAAERRRIRLHGKPWDHGILWAPGFEIARLDYIDDDPLGDTDPIYEGDLEAAHVVAENGYPWLLFEDWGAKVPAPRWCVCAFDKEWRAEAYRIESLQLAAEEQRAYTGVVFDGRSETLVLHPSEGTYLGTAVPRS